MPHPGCEEFVRRTAVLFSCLTNSSRLAGALHSSAKAFSSRASQSWCFSRTPEFNHTHTVFILLTKQPVFLRITHTMLCLLSLSRPESQHQLKNWDDRNQFKDNRLLHIIGLSTCEQLLTPTLWTAKSSISAAVVFRFIIFLCFNMCQHIKVSSQQ